MSNSEESAFYVKSDDVGFANRQKSIFEQLDVAEKEKKERQNLTQCVDPSVAEDKPEAVDLDQISKSHLRQRLKTKHFRGKESIFKKPLPPPPPHFKHTPVPDYRRHPDKWTKYTLDDVSKEDMSDRSNTTAALSFLNEIKIRKEKFQMNEDEVDPSTKVVFRQPKRKAETQECVVDAPVNDTILEGDKPSFKCSKLIMPEYVVGQSKKIVKKKSNKTLKPKNDILKVKEVKLGHLMDEDDND